MGRNLISTRSGSETLKYVLDEQGQHHLGTCYKVTFLGPTLELQNQKLWQGQLSAAAACPVGDGSAWWGLRITVLETKASTTRAAICLDTVCGIRMCLVLVLSESPIHSICEQMDELIVPGVAFCIQLLQFQYV